MVKFGFYLSKLKKQPFLLIILKTRGAPRSPLPTPMNIQFHVLSNIPPLSNDYEALWLETLTDHNNFVLAVVYGHPI